MKKKIVYTFLITLILGLLFISFKIISGKYDKQNAIILFFKEIVPVKLKNNLRNYVYEFRTSLDKNKIENLQKAKWDQGFNGELISSKTIKSNSGEKKYNVSEFFLPFERLDLSYGYAALSNAKRAHYLETINDKTLIVSGEGEFIFFDTKNFTKNKLNQSKLDSNLLQIIQKNEFEFIGLRDLLIDKDNLYLSVVLKDTNENYTISILTAELNFNKLDFKFFFKTNLNIKKFSIGTGGRIVSFRDNKLLFTVGHLNFLDEIQDPNHLAGKIISIDKNNKSFELVSLGHRNHQGLFYFKDKLEENQFVISSEHGPKGGDEINVNNLKNNRVVNFGWPIASYGINYDGTNPFKPSHKKYGFEEPLVNFTPSIGISEISVVSDTDSNTIYASSLRAKSIYIVKTNKEFSKIAKLDRLIFDHRIRDIKYEETLDGFLVIFENTPSVGFIKAMINN